VCAYIVIFYSVHLSKSVNSKMGVFCFTDRSYSGCVTRGLFYSHRRYNDFQCKSLILIVQVQIV